MWLETGCLEARISETLKGMESLAISWLGHIKRYREGGWVIFACSLERKRPLSRAVSFTSRPWSLLVSFGNEHAFQLTTLGFQVVGVVCP